MATLQDWYMEVPLITRVYLTSSMITTAACSLELVSPFSLFFNTRLVFVKLQARALALALTLAPALAPALTR